MNQSAVKGVVTASAFCGSTYPVPLWFFLLLKMNQKTVIEMLKKTIEPKTIQTIATVDKGITPKISSLYELLTKSLPVEYAPLYFTITYFQVENTVFNVCRNLEKIFFSMASISCV